MVTARARDPESLEQLDLGASQVLSFHENAVGTTLIYDDEVRRSTFNGGDILGTQEPEADGVQDAITVWAPLAEDAAATQVEVEPESAALPVVDDLGSLTPSTGAPSYNMQLCVLLKVHSWDSGYANSKGIEEDHWNGIDVPALVPAHGIKVKIGGVTHHADISTGCVDFVSGIPAFSTTVKVYSRASLANGTGIRVHDGSGTVIPPPATPGSPYLDTTTNVSFSSSGGATVVTAGDYGELWTGVALFAKSLERYNDGLPANTQIQIAVDGVCGALNVNYANNVTTNRSYIQMQAPNCGGSNLKAKFIVSHEYGHAYGAQIADKPGFSPSAGDHSVTPNGSCVFEPNSEYSIDSKEWSSLSLREGWAHFVSARIWNNESSDGQFRQSTSHDLERWDATNTIGGHNASCCPTNNQACRDSTNGAGTIGDWMRALWDLHSDSCSGAPNKLEMAELYGRVVNEGLLSDSNAAAVAYLKLSSPGCLLRWERTLCWNGLLLSNKFLAGSCL